jgi:hypothetical protein
MKIVVLSTDTEHYLLQWWFQHHKNKFDLGVVLDFNTDEESDDNTYELYKKFVPEWRYYKVTQKTISNFLWDVLIEKVERDLLTEFPGSWITTLNATEFLVGNLNSLDAYKTKRQVLIPCHLMNDLVENEGVELDVNVPLLQQRHHGVHYKNDFPHPHRGKSINLFNEQKPEHVILNTRWMRSIHNYEVGYLTNSVYSVGRHFWDLNNCSKQLAICHMNLSPYNNTFLKRKMHIQRRLTDSDHKADRGIHHRVNETKLLARKRFYDQLTIDLSNEINELENMK